MNPIFGRWLPAIAETTITRWLPALAQSRVRRLPALAQNQVRRLPALAETPVVRRSALAVAGLTCAAGCAAVAGGPAGTVAVVGGPAAHIQQVQAGGSDETPSRGSLVPHGVQGAQSHIDLDGDQWDNAAEIVRVARKEGVGPRGAVIGVATSLQESKLRNLGHLGANNDHDSLGLFQQRPSSGWGTPDQLTDRDYSASAFFSGLKRVNGWQDMPLTDAAQAVQVSAYPFAYAQWENQAADIVQQVWSHAH